MSDGLEVVRAALGHARAWLVGGIVRDRWLGRAGDVVDLDVVVDGDPAEAASVIARAAGGAARFPLSHEFGGWRVVARDRSWQVDVERMRGRSLDEDLGLRDFTVNAIAEPLDGGAPIDPLGGLADLAARQLRMAGPQAFADDPLRVLRLVRVAVELDLHPDADAFREARRQVGGLRNVSGERAFVELRRILASARAVEGLEMMGELGAAAVVLPELEHLHGVQQNRFHHRDVYGHTLEVLERTVELSRAVRTGRPLDSDVDAEEDRDAVEVSAHGELELAIGAHREQVAALLEEPLADELTRGEGLRWGALLHDAAKPLTRNVRPDGRVTFLGHDERGAELARSLLGRLRASERLRSHVAALVRHHLRLGFLVHEPQPLARRTVFAYLCDCSPVEVDVTLLSIADRLATRGDRSRESIDAHLRLADTMLGNALRWRAEGPPRPLLRGDELARELEIAEGPQLGALLAELAAAQYAGEIATSRDALEHARAQLAKGPQ